MAPHPVPTSSRTAATHPLVALAHLLLRDPADPTGPPTLVGVEPDPTGSRRSVGRLVLVALDADDVASTLVGTTAPIDWSVVGLAAGAGSLRPDRVGPAHGTVVHLLDRDGTSVTLWANTGSAPSLVGPTRRPAFGRVPDACRRVLGLATAPPPHDMTTHVVDLWLSRIARAALDQVGLDWPEVVARNPVQELGGQCTAVPTPAAMARRIAHFGEQLDWERYRRRCAEAGGTPFGELDATAVNWMDAGMFARWLLGEALPWPAQMDLLSGLLTAGAIDRLWATLALCPPQGSAHGW